MWIWILNVLHSSHTVLSEMLLRVFFFDLYFSVYKNCISHGNVLLRVLNVELVNVTAQ